ncbi:MAG: hypothetical protein QOG25_1943 [Acetobacteraceae bacterium]|nr:hypothetical protein [Acetobacteraceae bacterium]
MHNHTAMSGKTFTLTTGVDRIRGDEGNDTIVAASGTLSRGDRIDGDGGTNTLMLSGGGTFDLSLPSRLKNIQVVDAQETTVVGGGVTDPTGDFIPSFTGANSPDLDVVSFSTTFDGSTFHISGTLNGNIGTLPTSLYVIGFDRGAGTPRFAAINEPGVLFDSVVTLTGTGVATVNLLAPTASSTPLPDNAVHISGSTFEIDVPAALLPSAGLSPADYRVNLWPRDTSQPGNAAVADFAPENAVLAVSSQLPKGGVTDPLGDFIPSFTGAKSPDLDVLSFATTFDGSTFHISGTLNGSIGTLATSLYVIGFDRGAGTPRFAAINEPGVLFDSVVTLTGTGVATVNLLAPTASSTPLPASAVHISGASFEVDVPAALLPSAGLSPADYRVNLWPRDTTQVGNAAIADFAPENAVLTVSPPPQAQIVTLRDGTHLTVNVTAAPASDLGAGITIIGADNKDVINLAGGNDKVILGSDKETVHGKGGSNVFQVNAETIGATIDGGGGKSLLLVTGDNAKESDSLNEGDDDKSIVMGGNITNVATVKLDVATGLQLNGIEFLHAIGSDGADTIKAGGTDQTLTGGKSADTLAGFAGGSDTFLDTAAGLDGDTIRNFVASDRIDITDLGFAAAQLTAIASGGDTEVTVKSGLTTTTFTMTGSLSAGGFQLASDGATGTSVTHN